MPEFSSRLIRNAPVASGFSFEGEAEAVDEPLDPFSPLATVAAVVAVAAPSGKKIKSILFCNVKSLLRVKEKSVIQWGI